MSTPSAGDRRPLGLAAVFAAISLVAVSCGIAHAPADAPRCAVVKSRLVAPGLGGRISLNSGGGGHCYGVFVMNADGSGVREVTKPPLVPYFYAPWSPDGRLFAFAGDCGPPNQWNICVVNADGTGLRAVAPGPKVDTPAWSPDSTRLAFVRQDKDVGKWGLYTVGLDGSDERRVTDATGIAASPSWSPDGAWIAFTIEDGANKQVFKVPSGGGKPVSLAPGGQINGDPAWSHDGRRILFSSNRSGKPPSAYVQRVAKLPGGSLDPPPGAEDIFVMDADGTNVLRLTNDASGDFWPTWSPDDEHIAFVTDRDDIQALYVMKADGSDQMRLWYNGDSGHASWIA